MSGCLNVSPRQVPVTARTRTRLFLLLALAILSLAWLDPSSAPVRAIPSGEVSSHDASSVESEPPQRAEISHGPLSKTPGRGPVDAVVVVSIDGLRPDVLTPSVKALHQLSQQGTSARVARTINKSATLPSHASMVSGVEPA